MMFLTFLKLSLTLIYCNEFKFQAEPNLQTGKKNKRLNYSFTVLSNNTKQS